MHPRQPSRPALPAAFLPCLPPLPLRIPTRPLFSLPASHPGLPATTRPRAPLPAAAYTAEEISQAVRIATEKAKAEREAKERAAGGVAQAVNVHETVTDGHAETEVGGVIKVSTPEEFASLKARPGVLVVDFYATWCRKCIALGPKFKAWAKEVQGEVEGVVFASVDVNKVGRVPVEEGVRQLPMIAVYRGGVKVKVEEGGFASLKGVVRGEEEVGVESGLKEGELE